MLSEPGSVFGDSLNAALANNAVEPPWRQDAKSEMSLERKTFVVFFLATWRRCGSFEFV
jgi:hypothetical protein